MEKCYGVQEDVLDSVVQDGEVELKRQQDGIDTEDEETINQSHPAEVTIHDITQE